MTKVIGKELADQLKYEVTAIRTTNTNEKTDAHECAAELKFTGKAGTNSSPITYTVEKTDDGDQFYVNVYGL